MTNEQWQLLTQIVRGETPQKPVTGFIIDSPWLPGWAGVSTLQYYSSEQTWFDTNKKAIETFPDILFLPGFWSEFGMCTEPSAFGAKTVWNAYSLPHANRVLSDISQAAKLKVPHPKTDGLLPFVIQRLLNYHTPIRHMGHEIKFAIARGPLNIASFLMGTTELMMAFMMDPENSHKLLETITRFTIDWVQYQKEMFPSIEGILLLDDIVGFIGEEECKTFAIPYIKRIYQAFDSEINFFHNDAQGLVSTPFLREMGVNFYNFSFEHSMNEIRELAGPEVTLIGNLPPRDVLAAGTPEQVRTETRKMVEDFGDAQRVIWSCGGGMPQDVTTENIRAFKETIDKFVPQMLSKKNQ
ncbi:uroporphyrinogen decarboxylase [Maribellus sp. CM-23]|uniref:uroporphyrinogen decarboxylase family protein n=1 Tax=Maribellus sp. CM-23 TaxID=2781026 RepID=UPI001F1A9BBE|nr:uroporphyrinogen decarboxylase family protein [Maribellus sp. CM-23]MCE4563426.1 uroporphyrinogen decarboxylase [Maribellus sp. CM-23]